MFADFYIPRLSNDLKIAVQKNDWPKLGTEVWTLLKYFLTPFLSVQRLRLYDKTFSRHMKIQKICSHENTFFKGSPILKFSPENNH